MQVFHSSHRREQVKCAARETNFEHHARRADKEPDVGRFFHPLSRMARFKRFTHSLASGYVMLGANTLYTLASIPLALAYLSKEEFGLWAVVMQISGYIALVDFGMSASVGRILIDYKDRRADGSYGAMIQTGLLVGTVQGALVFVVGGGLTLVLGAMLGVPETLARDFRWLMIGQCAVLAFAFATRIFGQLTTAHQRYDIGNYTHSFLFAVNYGIMWVCFAAGVGVFSLLWAQAVTNLLAVTVMWLACVQLKLLPARGEWGRPNRRQFSEVFWFGRDIFFYTIGAQLITTSQTILLTRLIGLEMAGIWTVCTRAYQLLTQLIYRVFDYTTPALAEMMVRGEQELLRHRFKQIAVLSASLSVAAGMVFAVSNSAFVEVWTSGKMSWPQINDALLAIWLVISTVVHAHTGLVGQTKKLKFLRYLFFFEGATFVGLTFLTHQLGGVTAMLLTSIVCSLCFSFPYGLRRTKQYFGISWKELVEWHLAPARLGLWVLPMALAAYWFTRNLSPLVRLLINGSFVGGIGLWAFLRHGLERSLHAEILTRAPAWARSVLALVGLHREA